MRLAFKSGALVPVVLMLPNVVWMVLFDMQAVPSVSVPTALSIAENASRVAVLALPFFYALDVKKPYSPLAIAGMASALTLYYVAWARFFLGGGSTELFSAPLWGIPGPLALAPVALLICSSYLMSSWWMFGASLFFGALHVWSSSLTSMQTWQTLSLSPP